MPSSRTLISFGILLTLVAGGLLMAHPDDPKGLIRRTPYRGPGYRRTAPFPTKDFAVGSSASALGFPASGVRLMSWLPLGEFGNVSSGNDCWGYVSGTGREYAIMGLSTGTGFVEITDPGNPQIIDTIPGVFSTWRDIKTYQTYAYSVTEGFNGGIQVIDLSLIDSGTVTLVNTVLADIDDPVLPTGSSHNVAIDEDSGFLYRTGGGSNGLRIYSLADPANPAYVGAWTDRYIHDAQVVTFTKGTYTGKQIAFCCSGFNGGSVETGLDILDVTDKNNIINLSRLLYANGRYSHQAWLSPDRTYLYLNDELDEGGLGIPTNTKIINVSDLSLPVELPSFSNSSDAIGHNLYTLGNLIFEANYRSGVRIFDATVPTAPVETAYFDTWPDDDNTSFNGLWSVYPYFPSGTFIGSDLERGLFVWQLGAIELAFDLPQGPPASIAPTNGSITVSIVEQNGGQLVPGSPTLHYDEDGDGTYTTVAMNALGNDDYEGVFPTLDCFSNVKYFFSAETASGFTWHEPVAGEQQALEATVIAESTVDVSDDFETDTGWSVLNSTSPLLTDGAWERGTPIGGGDRGDPPTDADGSGQCYLTDNVDGNSDVDGGTTMLISPLMNASSGDGVAYVGYWRWFSESSPGSDSMLVELSNDGGGSWVVLEEVVANEATWVRKEFRIDDHFSPTSQMQLRVTVGDLAASVVEAGIDGVEIIHYRCFSPGDANGDGSVNVPDLIQLLLNWGPCAAPCPVDFNTDGVVNVPDLITILTNWG